MADKSSFTQLKLLPHGVYLLNFAGGDEQHRFNPTSIAAINAALDKVEGDENAAALVTTNEGKFFSNGLDLGYARSSAENFGNLIGLYHKLLQRMLSFPIPTVAAICGHAAAAGCMFALSHDFAVMRRDRGFIFMNEIEIDLHMSPGMVSILRAKLPVGTFHKTLLTAHKFPGKEAEEAGFVYASFPDAQSTLDAAVGKATMLAKKDYNRSVYKAIKVEMFGSVIRDFVSGGRGPPPGVVITQRKSKL